MGDFTTSIRWVKEFASPDSNKFLSWKFIPPSHSCVIRRMAETKTISMRLPVDVIERIDRLAIEESRSRTGQFNFLLRDWLSKTHEQPKARRDNGR